MTVPASVSAVSLGLALLGALGSFASLIGLFGLRRKQDSPDLVYEASPWIPLAVNAPLQRDYRLELRYTAPGAKRSELLSSAWANYLRFANTGTRPIRSQDVATANPLRIEASGGRVLDISLAIVTREVNGVRLDSPTRNRVGYTAALTFDFLDAGDGGVIRIVADKPLRLAVQGDIIGIPGGPHLIGRQPWATRMVPLAIAALLSSELASFSVAIYLIAQVTGSARDSWILGVTPVAFLLPLMILWRLNQRYFVFERWPAGLKSDAVWTALPEQGGVRMLHPLPPESGA